MMFSYEALYFLGTLPFPPAMYSLWGSWVTRLEISISPQNNKLKRVIFTFTERCGFLRTKNIFMVYGDLCKCVLLKIEIFKTVPAEDSRQGVDSGMCMFVSTSGVFMYAASFLRARAKLTTWQCGVHVAVWHNSKKELWLKRKLT